MSEGSRVDPYSQSLPLLKDSPYLVRYKIHLVVIIIQVGLDECMLASTASSFHHNFI
jgi:hypothetical protein